MGLFYKNHCYQLIVSKRSELACWNWEKISPQINAYWIWSYLQFLWQCTDRLSKGLILTIIKGMTKHKWILLKWGSLSSLNIFILLSYGAIHENLKLIYLSFIYTLDPYLRNPHDGKLGHWIPDDFPKWQNQSTTKAWQTLPHKDADFNLNL